MLKDIDKQGIVINTVFATFASFVFGDHLGFTAVFISDLILPVIVGKLAGGISAVVLATVICECIRKDSGVYCAY